MFAASVQRLLDLKVVAEDTDSHEVIQHALLVAQEDLATRCNFEG